MSGRTFTVAQAAKYLKVHAETVRRAIRTGELIAVKDRLAPGCPYVIAQAHLDAFAESRRH